MSMDARLPLLIVLKTRNEPAALGRWLSHHRVFVETGAVLVVDNASTDPQVQAIYDAHRDRIDVRVLQGPQDLLHHPERNRDLYEHIFSRARHVTFIDTDEWLYATDGGTLRDGRAIVDLLDACTDDTLLPGLWLQNRNGTAREFLVNDTPSRASHACLWGKPVIPTAPGIPRGFINHNVQLLEKNAYSSVAGGIVVAHLSMLDAAERINANVNKLISKRLIASREEWPAVASNAERLAGADQHVRLYVAETLALMKPGALAYTPPRPGEGGWVARADDGTLRFADDATAQVFRQAVAHPVTWTRS